MTYGCMTSKRSPITSIFLPLILAVLFVLPGCAGHRGSGELAGAAYYFNQGEEYMKKKNYSAAQTSFQTIVDSYSGSELIDSAQFMLAEAHFMNEDYITAAYEYERLYQAYPTSMFTEEAMFKRAVCYFHESPKASLDQENTKLAIEDFNHFIDTYPISTLVDEAEDYIDELNTKLAYKEYKNAELYAKLKKYESAIIYYRMVIEEYPRTPWANESRYGIGEVYMKQKQYDKAREQFQALVTAIAKPELKERAQKRLDDIDSHED